VAAAADGLHLAADGGRRLSGACNVICGVDGMSFSCASRIRYAAMHQFKGQAGACQAGFGKVLAQCSVCAGCPFSEVDCGAGRATPSLFSPVPVPAPVAAPAPAAQGAAACNSPCSYKGKTATCKFRIQWGAHHRYKQQSRACKKAWIMVGTQCPQCTNCPVESAGCVELPPPPPSAASTTRSPLPFDCLPDRTNRVAGWSDEKRQWCCHKRGRGCLVGGDVGDTVPYDCLASLSHWRSAWSSRKRRWCCAHRHRGCAGESASRSASRSNEEEPSDDEEEAEPSYDCDEGRDDWEETWSERKKAWCCKKGSRGCDERPVPFDCLAGYARWEDLWSKDKIHWCCRHRGKGCPSVGSEPNFKCSDDSRWRVAWPQRKKQWCCRNEQALPEDIHDWCCGNVDRSKGCDGSSREAKFLALPTVPPGGHSPAGAWIWTGPPALCLALGGSALAALVRAAKRRRRSSSVGPKIGFQPMLAVDEH